MEISNGFFLIQNVKKADNGKLELVGKFITDAVEVISSHSESPKNKPPFKIAAPDLSFKLKYILPPKGSPFYDKIKAAAEIMGYDTVEHEDFSYPKK